MRFLFLALALLLATTGCTAIGHGIGAEVPRRVYDEEVEPAVGDEVVVWNRDGRRALGRLESEDRNGTMVVREREGGVWTLPREVVARRATVVEKDHAVHFMIIGMLIDTAAIAGIVAAAVVASAQKLRF